MTVFTAHKKYLLYDAIYVYKETFELNNILKIIALISVYSIPQLAIASDVLIDTGHSLGQGFLLKKNQMCYLVTPHHVVEGVDKITAMTPDRKEFAATIIHKFDDIDVSILKIANPTACQFAQEEPSTRLSSILKIYQDGVLHTKLDDGSTLRTKVNVLEVENSQYLKILHLPGSSNLKQGFSGSILFMADQPAGMLLQVDEENYGVVYRYDSLNKNLIGFFGDGIDSKKIEEPQLNRIGERYKTSIAEGQVITYSFAFEENSPLILNFPKSKDKLNYYVSIIDPEGEVALRQSRINSERDNKVPFTPQETGVYTVQLKGRIRFGSVSFSLDQLSVDSQLRGKGNIIEIGDEVTVKIAPEAIAEFKYAAMKNSPIILSFPKSKHDLDYYVSIIDPEGEVAFRQSRINSLRDKKLPFTPLETGVYTVQLKGHRNFGALSFSLDQLSVDSQLRGKGNIIEIGDEVTVKIAPEAIAEFKYAAMKNSPIILSFPKSKHDLNYYVSIIDPEGEVALRQSQINSERDNKVPFTPLETGVYTVQLKGRRNFGIVTLVLE